MYIYVEVNPTKYIGIYFQVIADQMQPDFSYNSRSFWNIFRHLSTESVILETMYN